MWTRHLGRGVPGLALLALVLIAVSAQAERSAPDSASHLFSVPNDGVPAAALARTQARVVARYEAFTLVEAAGGDAARLRRAGADQRDDMREVRLGRSVLDPATERAPLAGKQRVPDDPGLAVVQFVGPIKDAWLERLRKTGVRVVTYMAENGYLVRGSGEELAAVGALVGSDAAVRAVVPFGAADKLGAGVRTEGRQRLAVQTLSGGDGSRGRSRVDAVGRELQGSSTVGPFRTHYVELDAADAAALARDPGVISIQPAPEPRLSDEVANQIVAGALTGPNPLVPTGPGYLAFYDALGLGSGTFPFVVDVADEGIDVGSTSTGQADFHEGGNLANPSRIAYADDFTSDPDARDCGGHGTINASIIGGFNDGTGAAVEDAAGFNYGLGVAPRAQLGASKIFLCSNGNFGLIGTITALTSSSYEKNARIANHSWGANTGGAYNATAQEFDALVRDAQPGTPGNQEMVEVVAAGNVGSAANTVGSPATAKNVIAAGAAESVRAGPAPNPPGTDGCGITDLGADDAHDIISFSSRGPTDDGRIKPDVVGPGTHVTGTQSDAVGYNGSGVCTPAFPTGSTLYSMSSGTSHSAPVVTGMAALFREWFRQNRGGDTAVPSPALTKAVLANAATDLNGGDGVGGNLPNNNQGWGLGNLARTLATGPRFFSDQQTTFGATGDESVRTFQVQDPSEPVRITLAWTDAPGPTVGNSFVNNLDLSAGGGFGTFKGNVFSAGVSAPGGTADPRNNLESVYLPGGSSGSFSVAVTAANIAGDGVPGNGDGTDQDFALVVSNAVEVTAPVFTPQDTTATAVGGDGDAVVEPGERFALSQEIRNTGNAAGTSIRGGLEGSAQVTITDGSAAWPDLNPGQSAINSDGLAGRVDPGATCGAPLALNLAITSAGGEPTSMPVTVETGVPVPTARESVDVPKAIPDNSPAGVSSTLAVADQGLIRDVDVRIGSITHPFVGDLRLELTSPTGTTVTLANRIGGGGDNFSGTVFDDEASVAIGAGGTSAPYTGSFRPQADQLSRLDGESQQGTWTLKVSDLAAADVGNLNSWGLDVAVGVCDFVPPAAPGQPSGLVATAGADSVALDWDDTPSATDYEIFRRDPGGGYPANPTATTTSSAFTDAGRTPGQESCYRVGALNGASPGPLSEERCATAPLPAGPPGGPPAGVPPGGSLPGEVTIDLSGLARSVRVSSKGTFVLSFLATPGRAGSIRLTTVKAVSAARKRKLVVARRSFTVPAGGRVRLRLKLNRKGLRVLKRVRRLPVSARVTLGTRTASRRVTLRAPRARPRR